MPRASRPSSLTELSERDWLHLKEYVREFFAAAEKGRVIGFQREALAAGQHLLHPTLCAVRDREIAAALDIDPWHPPETRLGGMDRRPEGSERFGYQQGFREYHVVVAALPVECPAHGILANRRGQMIIRDDHGGPDE
jgi:hypothetical protein